MKRRAVAAPELPNPITKADIEAKLREAAGELDDDVEHGRRFMPYVAGAAAVIVVVYRLGLRRGTRHSTMLEIRRIMPG